MEKTFNWMYNIIGSCNNDFHFNCADVLISLFTMKYGENEMTSKLKELRQTRWVQVHTILV
jgi:hypothetical protein